MSVYIRKLRGVIGIALVWAPVWVVLFVATIGSIIAVLGGGSDVGPLRMVAIIAWVGLVSGAIFGILLSVTESGKAIRNLSLGRAASWGMLGSAVFPLLTQREDQVFWTCPLGAVVAMMLVAVARKAEIRDSTRPRRVRDMYFACVLTLVRDAVTPSTETAAR